MCGDCDLTILIFWLHPHDRRLSVQIRKRGKDPRVKPILINKEDPSCVTDLSTPPSPTSSLSNHFEEIHPKDEFELLHSAQAADKVRYVVEVRIAVCVVC